MGKLKVMTKISEKIQQEVQDFWKGVNIEKSKLMLDGEQIAMIYEYIAIKSHVNNPFAQIRLCREFSTKQIRNMREGYCLVTLELALNQLIMAPELICQDKEAEGMFEESEQNWKQRSKSITNSFR